MINQKNIMLVFFVILLFILFSFLALFRKKNIQENLESNGKIPDNAMRIYILSTKPPGIDPPEGSSWATKEEVDKYSDRKQFFLTRLNWDQYLCYYGWCKNGTVGNAILDGQSGQMMYVKAPYNWNYPKCSSTVKNNCIYHASSKWFVPKPIPKEAMKIYTIRTTPPGMNPPKGSQWATKELIDKYASNSQKAFFLTRLNWDQYLCYKGWCKNGTVGNAILNGQSGQNMFVMAPVNWDYPRCSSTLKKNCIVNESNDWFIPPPIPKGSMKIYTIATDGPIEPPAGSYWTTRERVDKYASHSQKAFYLTRLNRKEYLCYGGWCKDGAVGKAILDGQSGKRMFVQAPHDWEYPRCSSSVKTNCIVNESNKMFVPPWKCIINNPDADADLCSSKTTKSSCLGSQTNFNPRACSWVSPNTGLSSLVHFQEKAISEGWIKENLNNPYTVEYNNNKWVFKQNNVSTPFTLSGYNKKDGFDVFWTFDEGYTRVVVGTISGNKFMRGFGVYKKGKTSPFGLVKIQIATNESWFEDGQWYSNSGGIFWRKFFPKIADFLKNYSVGTIIDVKIIAGSYKYNYIVKKINDSNNFTIQKSSGGKTYTINNWYKGGSNEGSYKSILTVLSTITVPPEIRIKIQTNESWFKDNQWYSNSGGIFWRKFFPKIADFLNNYSVGTTVAVNIIAGSYKYNYIVKKINDSNNFTIQDSAGEIRTINNWYKGLLTGKSHESTLTQLCSDKYYNLKDCDKKLYINAKSKLFQSKSTTEDQCEKICSENCECDMYLMQNENKCHLYKDVNDVNIYCGAKTKPSDGSADYYGKIKNKISSNIKSSKLAPSQKQTTESPTSKSQYLLGKKNILKCPDGYVGVDKSECESVGKQLLPSGKSMGRKLQTGDWSWVPSGCSLQSEGDWAAHYNSGVGATESSLDKKSGYRKVCKESQYLLGKKNILKCPDGYVGVDKSECESVGKQLLPSGKSMGRTLQSGDWSWVPSGCSLQSDGDWAAHYNSGVGATESSLDKKSGYRKVCKSPTTTMIPTTDMPLTTDIPMTTDMPLTTDMPMTTDMPLTTDMPMMSTTDMPMTTDTPMMSTTDIPMTTDMPMVTTTDMPMTTRMPMDQRKIPARRSKEELLDIIRKEHMRLDKIEKDKKKYSPHIKPKHRRESQECSYGDDSIRINVSYNNYFNEAGNSMKDLQEFNFDSGL